MKLIDFENHFYDQCLIDALESRTEPPYYRKDTDLITWSDAITMPQGLCWRSCFRWGKSGSP